MHAKDIEQTMKNQNYIYFENIVIKQWRKLIEREMIY